MTVLYEGGVKCMYCDPPQLPGSEEGLLYNESGVTVLAVRGLTELAAASYTEDQYGVVQAVSSSSTSLRRSHGNRDLLH